MNSQQTENLLVARVSSPTTSLFEVTGFVELNGNYPKANAFVMFVPGARDNTKQTNRTYVQDKKETMKLSIRDIYALGEALKYASTYGKCDFIVFTDSSKFSGNTQNKVIKKLSVTAAPSNRDPNKLSIFLTYQGSQKINIMYERWHAMGLANQLMNLANHVENKKHEMIFKRD